MLGIDIAVWMALLLSLASVVLCVAYGWARWNVGDDAASGSTPAVGISEPAESTTPKEHA